MSFTGKRGTVNQPRDDHNDDTQLRKLALHLGCQIKTTAEGQVEASKKYLAFLKGEEK